MYSPCPSYRLFIVFFEKHYNISIIISATNTSVISATNTSVSVTKVGHVTNEWRTNDRKGPRRKLHFANWTANFSKKKNKKKTLPRTRTTNHLHQSSIL